MNQLLMVSLAAQLPVERYLQKVSAYPPNPDETIVTVDNPITLSKVERSAILNHIAERNYVVYQYDEGDPSLQSGYQHICHQLGLVNAVTNPASDEQGVTAIEAVEENSYNASRYIPFSTKALNWHTDGYYNEADQTIRAFVLHCRQSALSGGITSLIDHELIFALLYQQNPDWIEALAQNDVLTVPPNIHNGRTLRTEFTGAVFQCDPVTGRLVMRYTERKRNIKWRDDVLVAEALDAIQALLRSHSHWVTRIKLEPGQGIIANNVLHSRSAFCNPDGSATKGRKLERIRFSDQVNAPVYF